MMRRKSVGQILQFVCVPIPSASQNPIIVQLVCSQISQWLMVEDGQTDRQVLQRRDALPDS